MITRAEKRREERRMKKILKRSPETQSRMLIEAHVRLGQEKAPQPVKTKEFLEVAKEIALPSMIEAYLKVPKVQTMLEDEALTPKQHDWTEPSGEPRLFNDDEINKTKMPI